MQDPVRLESEKAQAQAKVQVMAQGAGGGGSKVKTLVNGVEAARKRVQVQENIESNDFFRHYEEMVNQEADNGRLISFDDFLNQPNYKKRVDFGQSLGTKRNALARFHEWTLLGRLD